MPYYRFAVTGGSEGMDGFPVNITEAVCLGASLALSGICYYFYRKSRTTLDKLDVGYVSCVININLLNVLLLYFGIQIVFSLCFPFKPLGGTGILRMHVNKLSSAVCIAYIQSVCYVVRKLHTSL